MRREDELDETEEDSEPTGGELVIARRTEPGTAPGTLVVDPEAPPTVLRVIAFAPAAVDDLGEVAITEIPGLLAREDRVTWIDVVGLGDAVVLESLAAAIGMHRLVLEDVVNVHQRPKCEEYGDRVYLVTRMTMSEPVGATEQVSLFLGPRFLVTLQEQLGDCLEPVRRRLRDSTSRLRQRGADYLAYAVLDAITDGYFPVLEELGERLEALEVEALDRPSLTTLGRIRGIKRELMLVRRTLWPMREMLGTLLRDEVPWFETQTRVFLRDCYDHSLQLLDITDSCRELASGLMDVYLSSTGIHMNEVMKVLTIVSTVFIPLTFI
ncbi:MAG: magnesium/cobalt transporter CorA, partial [Planctomycetes bacterium]|nr:magnesium/cobalt transporter CorA [Planctomycetota bacterium]